MGEGVLDPIYTQQDLQRYREKIQRCLDALARMLAGDSFSAGPEQMGLELELNLIDKNVDPAMANQTVLKQINDPAFQTELGQHNIEINVAPRPLAADEALGLERELRAALNTANDAARNTGVGLVMIGILPTLRADHFDRRWMSPTSRYALLNTQILAARREELELNMEGVPLEGCLPERLRCAADSILPESGCTSVQLHLQVAPRDFAAHWNAAQALAGVQVALAANSPFLLGRALWHETRIPLFEQSTDTRSPELRNQGVRPRVWFGERWITSIFDLFEENVTYFPALLPVCEPEDPVEVLEHGGVPKLGELRLHNGTVYRWNRPIYDVVRGRPHLRVENRVLPAGPTVVDTIANAAFYYGLVRVLADEDRPLWSQMSFSAAEENFHAGARDGIDARVYWPGVGEVGAAELVVRRLLPMAHEGLDRWGVDAADRDRLCEIIERRCVEGRNGASWQAHTFHRLYERLDREDALREMTVRYREHMHSNEPVHTWPLD